MIIIIILALALFTASLLLCYGHYLFFFGYSSDGA